MRKINKCIAAGLFLVGLLSGLTACSNVPTWQEQYDLGMKYLEKGNYEEALTAFDSAIEIDAKKAAAFVGRADTYVALAENISGNTDSIESADTEAEADVDTDTTQDTDNTDGNEMSVGESQQTAQLLKIEKDDTSEEKTWLDEKREYLEKAEQDYQTAIDLEEEQTEKEAHRGRGDSLKQLGDLEEEEEKKLDDYEEALKEFEWVIENDGTNPEDYVSAGDLCVRKGETEENLSAAKDYYEKALKMDDMCVNGYLGMADVYIRQENYEEALRILEEGYDKTQDEAIQKKIEEVKSGTINDSQGRPRRVDVDIDGTKWYYVYQYENGEKATGVTSYDAEGNQTNSLPLTYDEAGNQLESFSIPLVKSSPYVEKEIDFYGENGKIIKNEGYNREGKLTCYYLYEYDGNTIKRAGYNADGSSMGYMIDEYDEDEHCIKSSSYSAEGKLYSYWEYEWENGRVVGDKNYSAEGKLRWSSIFEYDENGNHINEIYESY